MSKIAMKQAYENEWDYFDGNYRLVKIELLPECKRENIYGKTHEYQKVRKKFLGIIPYTKWLNKDYIEVYPKESVKYYNCSCGEQAE